MAMTDERSVPTSWVPEGLECFSVVRFEQEIQEELLTKYGRELLAASAEEAPVSGGTVLKRPKISRL